MKLAAIRMMGGKSFLAPHQTGPWVASLLPPNDKDTLYVEPFAGMLGVLLNRPRAYQEMVNDLDGYVIDYWEVVRDHYEELERLLRATPYSRKEFSNCKLGLTDQDISKVERVRRWVTVQVQSYRQTGSHWQWASAKARRPEDQIELLSKRIRDVQLESVDACKLLAKMIRYDNVIAYLDPPYKDTFCSYGHNELDREELTDILAQAKGRFAISGYGDEWDHLGWNKHSHDTFKSGYVPAYSEEGSKLSRVDDILWTNYQPDSFQPSLEL